MLNASLASTVRGVLWSILQRRPRDMNIRTGVTMNNQRWTHDKWQFSSSGEGIGITTSHRKKGKQDITEGHNGSLLSVNTEVQGR